MSCASNPFRYFNSSPEVIRLVVMMYVRFPLSLRNVEDCCSSAGSTFAMRRCGIDGTGSDRCSPEKFVVNGYHVCGRLSIGAGVSMSRRLAKLDVRDPKGSVAKINGERHYMWRAVDHEGEVLESYVTKKRDKTAALAFLKKALKRHGRVKNIVTDGVRTYPAAMRQLGNSDCREVGRWLNNRAENSHLPFRRRERAMQRFRRMKSLQKFASVHASFHIHFNLERHLVDRQTFKLRRSVALAERQSLAA